MRRELVVRNAIVTDHELVLKRARSLCAFLRPVDRDLTSLALKRCAVTVNGSVLSTTSTIMYSRESIMYKSCINTK